ncbi:terminase [Corynebacterium sp. p3-SID1194]|uniref:terminase n=1 Tax=Corynebacterium sp. p3-SID1194 TaxID=2916105 RepID=UPI0021A289D7|nr:terminase [Corynebacterium sp. p3-SID1194]MCT1450637.1 terminase [Corynebacterium sp. p3-SID1194]
MAGRKGNPEPRIFTPPLVELTPATSLGFEVIEFAENILGLTLRPWQKFVLIHGLELDMRTVPGSDCFDPETPPQRYYDYRFRQVVVLVARQNGKTVVMDLLGLWRLFADGASEILSSAQNLSNAERSLGDSFKMAVRSPVLAKYLPYRMERGNWVPYMRTVNGGNQIELASVPPGLEGVLDISGAMPSWYVVAAGGAGRSYSADLAMLDELRQHRTSEMWDAIEPTTKERPRNQIWTFSNAGDVRSVVLRRLRNLALKAIEEGTTDREKLCLMEWSAEPDRSIFDPDGWFEANPSLGWGNATEEDMAALARAALDPEDPDADESSFRTEYLCQWVESTEPGKFTSAQWEALADPLEELPEGAEVHVGIDCSLEARRTHIAVAFARPDGMWHVEVVASRAGFGWVPEWLNERRGGWFTGEVGLQSTGNAPATVLVPLLAEAGIDVAEWRGAAMTGSVLAYTSAIRDGLIRHPGRADGMDEPTLLESSALGVRDRKLSDVALWDRERSTGDAAPFIATNIAWWMGHRVEDQFVSAYADEDWDDELEESGEDTDSGDDDGLLIV